MRSDSGDYDGSGLTIREKENSSLWRSSWWNFGDGNGVVPRKEVPADVKRALTDLYEKWALNRYVMELGTCTNQWGKILENMAAMYEFTKSPVILEALRYNVKRMCTKNSLGRVNPDPDSFKSGYEADSGRIDNGIMAECLGHDNEYNLETDAHMSRVYRTTKQREIVDYQTAYYRLKTHLTLSRTGGIQANIFNGTCSPTDANFRTRFYTHKTGALLDLIPYGDLWNDGNGLKKSQWPWLEKEPFSRDLEGRYRAVNTGTYYALFYTGPSYPRWQAWGAPGIQREQHGVYRIQRHGIRRLAGLPEQVRRSVHRLGSRMRTVASCEQSQCDVREYALGRGTWLLRRKIPRRMWIPP